MDESADNGNIEQMAVYVRYSYKGVSRTRFLGLRSLPDGRADTITNTVVTFLNLLNISTWRVVCLTTDGCSTMIGKNNGVVTRFINQYGPHAINIHCLAHRLALAASDAGTVVKYISNIFKPSLYAIFLLFDNSPVRSSHLKEAEVALGEQALKMHKVLFTIQQMYKIFIQCGDTRWLSIDYVTQGLRRVLASVIVTVIENVNIPGNSSAAAAGIAKNLPTFSFIGTLCLFSDIMPLLTTLYNVLQQQDESFATVFRAQETCLTTIRAQVSNPGYFSQRAPALADRVVRLAHSRGDALAARIAQRAQSDTIARAIPVVDPPVPVAPASAVVTSSSVAPSVVASSFVAPSVVASSSVASSGDKGKRKRGRPRRANSSTQALPAQPKVADARPSRVHTAPVRLANTGDWKEKQQQSRDIREAMKQSVASIDPALKQSIEQKDKSDHEQRIKETIEKAKKQQERKEHEVTKNAANKRMRVVHLQAKIDHQHHSAEDEILDAEAKLKAHHEEHVAWSLKQESERMKQEEAKERKQLADQASLDRVIDRSTHIGDTIAALQTLEIRHDEEDEKKFELMRGQFVAAVRDNITARFSAQSSRLVEALDSLLNPKRVPSHDASEDIIYAYADARDAAFETIREQFGTERNAIAAPINCEKLPHDHSIYVAHVQGHVQALKKTHGSKPQDVSMPYMLNYFLASEVSIATPELCTLIEIALVISTSTAVVERGFSFLNNIKSLKRNRLSWLILDALLLIAIEGPDSVAFDFKRSVLHWWHKKLRRINI